jgi:hypothetical protein
VVYGTVLMAMVWMLAEADRNRLAVLRSPIQKDLGVGDTAMGPSLGIAFAAVYAMVMPPVFSTGRPLEYVGADPTC